MYIFIGLAILVVMLLFLFAKKMTPNSEMMVAFEEKNLQKFFVSMGILFILSISYGMYQKATYQLPYVDVKVEGKEYTVFGDIGKLGYFSDQLIKKNQESEVFLVTWNKLDMAKAKMIVHYPSGKEEVLENNMVLAENKVTAKIEKEHNIVGIYKLGSYVFTEKGDIVLQVKEEKEIVAETKIKVK